MEIQSQSQSQAANDLSQKGIICLTCKGNNRKIAKFCKECGGIIQSLAAENFTGISIDPESIAGLKDIKKSITDIINRVKIHNEKKSKGLSVDPLYLHCIFKGETGTGKTMIGKYFAQEFKKIGALSKESILEIDNETLEAEGKNLSIAIKTWIEKARGGILFFDEIHKSTESISTIIKSLETAGDDIIVIIAGLKDPIDKYFDENKDEEQRIGLIPEFRNYTEEELLQITLIKLRAQNNIIADDAIEILQEYIRVTMYSGKSEYKNGWLVEREIIPKILNRQGNRLAGCGDYSEENLTQITAADIPDEDIKRKTPEEILAAMDDLVGMDEIKSKIRKLAQYKNMMKEQQKLGMEEDKLGLHIVLTGNPGTGKNTVVRLLGDLFKAIGLLPSEKIIEVDKKDLVSQYVNETAQKTTAVIDKAIGGVLFIDEAYSLKPEGAGTDFGQEAIDTLVKRMEDDRGKVVVIAAGYKKEMTRFINSNPGLKRRFTDYFHLEDYKPDELFKIFCILAKNGERILSPDAETKVQDEIKKIYNKRDSNFANGREMRNLLVKTMEMQSARLYNLKPEERTAEVFKTILPEDIPSESREELSPDVILAQLDLLVGMDNIKKDIRGLVLFANVQMKREAAGLKKTDIVPHIILTGNPGTGKTTVARMIAKLFYSIGILSSGHCIEVDKSGLVAQFTGQTAQKVNDVVDSAMGGVLFIDEAYSLTSEGQSDSFSKDAIDTLVKRMSDDAGRFVVIAAGYPKEMERFLKSNSGLASRFKKTFPFEDYKPEELEKIFLKFVSAESYTLSEGAKPLLAFACRNMYEERDENFGNGRDMLNLFDIVIQRQSVRLSLLSEPVDNALYSIIEAEDFPAVEKKVDSLEASLARLDELIGLTDVKNEVKELINFLKVEKMRNDGDSEVKIGSHYMFTGNPGTGKTTVARILADIFKNMGLLTKGHLVEKDREGLVAEYLGQTAPKTAAVIKEAMGGILFIDEAYALVRENGGDEFGKEAIDTLVKRMSDEEGKFIVIAAGYKNEMKRFLNSNPGLPGRFQNTIEFKDYKPKELVMIFKGMAASKKMGMTPEFENKLTAKLTDMYNNRDANFANGRTVRNLFNSTRKKQSNRVEALSKNDPELFMFKVEDLV